MSFVFLAYILFTTNPSPDSGVALAQTGLSYQFKRKTKHQKQNVRVYLEIITTYMN